MERRRRSRRGSPGQQGARKNNIVELNSTGERIRGRRRRIFTIANIAIFGLGYLLGAFIAKGGKLDIGSSLKDGLEKIDPAIFNGRKILVLGTDASSGSTDVMFTIESDGDKTKLEQIPRDTMVKSDRFGIIKANALYTMGGPEEAEKEMSILTHSKIDHFARVNLEGVQKMGDVLDGVEVNVPFRMKYDDNSQNLHIDLYPGKQILKGKKLEGYIRYRHDGLGDIGRMDRQRAVYKALFEKALSPSSLIHLPELINIGDKDVKTDLSPLEVGALLGLMKGNKLEITRIDGRPVIYKDLSYWLPTGMEMPE